MRYLPLVWAGLSRRPLHPALTSISMMFATSLLDLMLEANGIIPLPAEFFLAVQAAGLLGLLLIAILTCHAVQQSLRARGWEFALLHALGFPTALLAMLLFMEVWTACLAGGAAGLVLAQAALWSACHLVGPQVPQWPFLSAYLIPLNGAAGIIISSASIALPAFRFTRLNLAAALAKGIP